MTTRVPKVEQAIKEVVALILQQELKDPRVGFVTVTQVRATGDLQHATIYFSALGPADVAAIEAGLKSATPYIRRLVGERLRLRYTPELRFQYDPSVEESLRIQRLLKEVQRSPDESPEGH